MRAETGEASFVHAALGEKGSAEALSANKKDGPVIERVDDSDAELSEEHKKYLYRRHGTLELDPLPYPTDADPYNWPQWKKTVNLILVAFHSLMGVFNAAAIIPAYQDIAVEFGTSVQQASYLTSIQIAILGGAPLFWRPLCNRFGRRPIFLLSLLLSCVLNIASAKSYSYGSVAACRALLAFFISPAGAIGSAVVAETFFKKDRARYMGVWTLLITLGAPIAPFIMGFVAVRVGYRWIYWSLAITHAVQLFLYALFGPETRYLGPEPQARLSNFRAEYFSLRRIDPSPFNIREFFHPLVFFIRPNVLIPAVAYAMVFLFGSVLITVEIPQLFGEKFQFNPQQLGLQFLGVIIGSLIGEQVGGALSDWWMSREAKKTGSRPPPEFRLWLSYPGVLLTVCGVVVFLVQTDRAAPLQWNVTPIVGAGIAGAGNQIVTTVLITYSVDCYLQDAASVGVFITFVRQVWGFIGPFWFPAMFDNVGLRGSAGICSALMVAVSLIPVILLHGVGRRWRNHSSAGF